MRFLACRRTRILAVIDVKHPVVAFFAVLDITVAARFDDAIITRGVAMIPFFDRLAIGRTPVAVYRVPVVACFAVLKLAVAAYRRRALARMAQTRRAARIRLAIVPDIAGRRIRRNATAVVAAVRRAVAVCLARITDAAFFAVFGRALALRAMPRRTLRIRRARCPVCTVSVGRRFGRFRFCARAVFAIARCAFRAFFALRADSLVPLLRRTGIIAAPCQHKSAGCDQCLQSTSFHAKLLAYKQNRAFFFARLRCFAAPPPKGAARAQYASPARLSRPARGLNTPRRAAILLRKIRVASFYGRSALPVINRRRAPARL